MQSTMNILGLSCKDLLAYSQLREAVQNRDEEMVIYLLTYSLQNLQIQRVDAQKLLHQVFKNVNRDLSLQTTIIKILGLLLDRGANIDVTDINGQTALHLAVTNRMTQVIDFLIKRDANMKVRDKNGNFILHFLIESEYEKLRNCTTTTDPDGKERQLSINFIQWLVPKAADFAQCKNNRQETALHLAAKYNMLQAIPHLLMHTKRARRLCNDRYMTAFQIFVETAICGRLVETFVTKIDEDLFTYVSNGDARLLADTYKPEYLAKICEYFLNAKFSVDVVDERNNTPIHYALKYKSKKIANLMMDRMKKDVRDDDGNTSLNVIMNLCEDKFYKFGKEDEDLIRKLITKETDIHARNKMGVSPLITAVKYRKLTVLEIFKESGAKFNKNFEENLLFYFFKSKIEVDEKTYQAVFELLVGQGCFVNGRDNIGVTPIHYAARLGKINIIEKLIENGSLINWKELVRGYTPLHEAILHKHLETAKLLINNGADVNAETYRNQKPLHLLDNSMEDLVEKLVRKNSQLDGKDDDGFLPLQTAILYQNDRIIKKLLEFGADINDIDNSVFDVNGYEVSKLITVHLIRLQIAKQHIDNRWKAYLSSSFCNTNVRENCLDEVKKLKNYKIDDKTSLYDLLHMNRNALCNFVTNQQLVELIDSTTLKEKFPMYYGLISSIYYMALRRKQLLKPAKDAWLNLTNRKLPNNCIYQILSFLSNVSLTLMAKKIKLSVTPLKRGISSVDKSVGERPAKMMKKDESLVEKQDNTVKIVDKKESSAATLVETSEKDVSPVEKMQTEDCRVVAIMQDKSLAKIEKKANTVKTIEKEGSIIQIVKIIEKKEVTVKTIEKEGSIIQIVETEQSSVKSVEKPGCSVDVVANEQKSSKIIPSEKMVIETIHNENPFETVKTDQASVETIQEKEKPEESMQIDESPEDDTNKKEENSIKEIEKEVKAICRII